MLFKKLVLALVLISSGLLFMQVSAQSGHVQVVTYFGDLRDQKGSIYEIYLDNDLIGEFSIKSVKVTPSEAKLKIEQTFHYDDFNYSITVNTKVNDDKILTFKVPNYLENVQEGYLFVIDFQNLESGTNSGLRIAYALDSDEDRELVTENITVIKKTGDE